MAEQMAKPESSIGQNLFTEFLRCRPGFQRRTSGRKCGAPPRTQNKTKWKYPIPTRKKQRGTKTMCFGKHTFSVVKLGWLGWLLFFCEFLCLFCSGLVGFSCLHSDAPKFRLSSQVEWGTTSHVLKVMDKFVTGVVDYFSGAQGAGQFRVWGERPCLKATATE